MKTLLTGATLLLASTGIASADVALTGDARMGLLRDYGADEISFTSRARVTFTLSGESDSGFSFGASFRADNAGDAAEGLAGSVYISGGFGKLTMGDVDGAAQAAVGQVSGVGLTGLYDLNEVDYVGDAGGGGSDPSILYEYSTGPLTGYFSAQNPQVDGYRYAVGVKYAADQFTVATGYESYDNPGNHIEQWIVGATGTFGPVTAKAIYVDSMYVASQGNEFAVSLDYTADALTLTAFMNEENRSYGTDSYYGLGASYDLGGGAKIVGGYVEDPDYSTWDLGLSFSF